MLKTTVLSEIVTLFFFGCISTIRGNLGKDILRNRLVGSDRSNGNTMATRAEVVLKENVAARVDGKAKIQVRTYSWSPKDVVAYQSSWL